MKAIQPNLVIFRVPCDDAILFVELDINEDGTLNEDGKVFTVADTDSYNEIMDCQIVLAHKADDGSEPLDSFTIFDEKANKPQVVHLLVYLDLARIVKQLIIAYNEDDAPSAYIH